MPDQLQPLSDEQRHLHEGCGGEVLVMEGAAGINAECSECHHRWGLLDSLDNVTNIPKGKQLWDRM